jgi:hypothetical protein
MRSRSSAPLGLANLFPAASPRGYHYYLKINYEGFGFGDFNDALDRPQAALKKLTGRRKCVVECKGKAGNKEHGRNAAGRLRVSRPGLVQGHEARY